MDYCLWSIN